MLDASSAASKCAVGEVRTGWIEAEELVKDDLELVLCERWFHILDAVYVGQPRDVVEEGWCGPGDDFWWIWKAARRRIFQAFST